MDATAARSLTVSTQTLTYESFGNPDLCCLDLWPRKATRTRWLAIQARIGAGPTGSSLPADASMRAAGQQAWAVVVVRASLRRARNS